MQCIAIHYHFLEVASQMFMFPPYSSINYRWCIVLIFSFNDPTIRQGDRSLVYLHFQPKYLLYLERGARANVSDCWLLTGPAQSAANLLIRDNLRTMAESWVLLTTATWLIRHPHTQHANIYSLHLWHLAPSLSVLCPFTVGFYVFPSREREES